MNSSSETLQFKNLSFILQISFLKMHMNNFDQIQNFRLFIDKKCDLVR